MIIENRYLTCPFCKIQPLRLAFRKEDVKELPCTAMGTCMECKGSLEARIEHTPSITCIKF